MIFWRRKRARKSSIALQRGRTEEAEALGILIPWIKKVYGPKRRVHPSPADSELIRSRRKWPEDLVTRRAAAGAEGEAATEAATEGRLRLLIAAYGGAPVAIASLRGTRA